MNNPYAGYREVTTPRSTGSGRLLLGIILGTLIGLGIYHEWGDRLLGEVQGARRIVSGPIYTETVRAESPPVGSEDDPAGIGTSRKNAIVRAVGRVEPAVVSISATRIQEYYVVDPFDWFFRDLRRSRKYTSKSSWMGSGFIVSRDGYIWTNEHVVRGADELIVNLPNGREFKAELIGSDTNSDVAVIQIQGADLPIAVLGNSNDLLIGEWAIAIGNPFGNIIGKGEPTVTVGVISALGRDFSPETSERGERIYRDMIQTDAAINKGNSGGPLVNSAGEVIGMNTFIFTGSQWEIGSIGLGFAIPINKIKKIAEEIIQYGEVRPFWTGLRVQNINDPLLAHSLGLSSTEGALITDVDVGSPADKAGLQPGDVIVQINGIKVKNKEEAREIFLSGGTVGDVYHLTVVREGDVLDKTIRLEEWDRRKIRQR